VFPDVRGVFALGRARLHGRARAMDDKSVFTRDRENVMESPRYEQCDIVRILSIPGLCEVTFSDRSVWYSDEPNVEFGYREQ
jgi:hypothetical protein